jgi:hypothetical protein
LYLEQRELSAELDHEIVKVLWSRVVGPALVSLQREDVEQQFQRVLALKRLLHVDFTQVVDPPETEEMITFII